MTPRLRYAFLIVPPIFYFMTTASTVGQADQAILIDTMYHGYIGSGATHHNLSALTGYLFSHMLPLREIAYRCNLVSTFFGSLTVVLFYLTSLRLTRSVPVAIFSSSFLLVSHSLWWHSTIAENYAASACLSAAVLYCLVRVEESGDTRWLFAAASLAGFGVFNHAQMGMWFPGILLAAVLRPTSSLRERLVRAAKTGLWIAVGLIPFGATFLRDLAHARSLGEVAFSATGGDFGKLFFSWRSSSQVTAALDSTLRIFMLQWGWPSVFWLFIAVGVYRALRGASPRTAYLAGSVAFLVNTGFFAFYPTWDKYAFLLQSFVVLSFVGMTGLAHLWSGYAQKRTSVAGLIVVANVVFCLYPVYFFERLPDLAERSAWWQGYVVREVGINKVGTDGEFLANPNKRGYRAMDEFARLLFARLPPDSVLIDDPSRSYYPLTYYFQQFYQMRRDVAVLLFAPSGLSGGRGGRWPDSITGPEAADIVARALSLGRPAFLSAHVGFDEVVGPSLDRGITFTEYPLGSHWEVYRARSASELDLKAWVAGIQVGLAATRMPERSSTPVTVSRAEAGSLGLYVWLKPGNPAMPVHVEWSSSLAEGGSVGRTLYVPQGIRSVFIPCDRGDQLAPGTWTAELHAFGQDVGSGQLRVE